MYKRQVYLPREDKIYKDPLHALPVCNDRAIPDGNVYIIQDRKYASYGKMCIRDSNVTHPKFGDGIVEKINLRSGGVHLHIRFDGEVKCIDQKWLMRRKYT